MSVTGYWYFMYKIADEYGKSLKEPELVEKFRGKKAAYDRVPERLIWSVGFMWRTFEGTFIIKNRHGEEINYDNDQRIRLGKEFGEVLGGESVQRKKL